MKTMMRRKRGPRRDIVVIDGANVMYAYSSAINSFMPFSIPQVPRTRGLELCLDNFTGDGNDRKYHMADISEEYEAGIDKMDESEESMNKRNSPVSVVAFVPADMVEGPLWRVADGSVTARNNIQVVGEGAIMDNLELVQRDIFKIAEENNERAFGGGDNVGNNNIKNTNNRLMSIKGAAHLWRNKILSSGIQNGWLIPVAEEVRVSQFHTGWPQYNCQARLVKLDSEMSQIKAPSRSKDDIAILRYARRHNGYILSNDEFKDHKAFYTQNGKGTRKWIKKSRIGFSFEHIQTKDALADEQRVSLLKELNVKCVLHDAGISNRAKDKFLLRCR